MIPAQGGQVAKAGLDRAAPAVPRACQASAEGRRMRVLVAITSRRLRSELARGLAAKGHEVVHLITRGGGLLPAIERCGASHALVLSQALLGNGWAGSLRHFCRRGPRVPVVLLLRPGAEWTWRFAFTAGAFEALPASASPEAVLGAVSRAIAQPEESHSTGTSKETETALLANRLGSVPPVEAAHVRAGTHSPSEEPRCASTDEITGIPGLGAMNPETPQLGAAL